MREICARYARDMRRYRGAAASLQESGQRAISPRISPHISRISAAYLAHISRISPQESVRESGQSSAHEECCPGATQARYREI